MEISLIIKDLKLVITYYDQLFNQTLLFSGADLAVNLRELSNLIGESVVSCQPTSLTSGVYGRSD